ncbi:MAG TPA: CapA family protein [Methylomirabilota bacterium]|nr:CapA family protein [Methylomirabilota bacterium]
MTQPPAQRKPPAARRYALALIFFCAFSIFILHVNRVHGGNPVRVTYPQELGRINFAISGDVIPHEAVVESATAAEKNLSEAAPAQPTPTPAEGATTPAAPASPPALATDHDGWDALFAGVADVFRLADYGFVNLETPVAPNHSHGTKPFMFNAPIALLESLKASGINIVSFANNHVFDQGYAAFNETLGHLQEQGLLYVGSGATAADAWKPVIIEKNGIKVGWLGMTRWLNGNRNPEKDSEPHVAFFPYPGESNGAPGLDEAGVLAAITAARAQCDFLLVSIHWGIEYAPAPRPEDVDMAHKMLEAGAGAIIGAHPHVLQPVETYLTQDHRKTVIFYSLGNFLSNQSQTYVGGMMPDKTGDPRDEMVARFSIVKKDYGPAGIQFELADVGIIPAWGENNRLRVRSGFDKVIFIHPVFIDREIPRIQARLDELSQPGRDLSAAEKLEFKQLSDQLALLKHRRELLLGRTGDDYLIPPPPLP